VAVVRGRSVGGILLVAALTLAGCSTEVTGRASPAPGGGPGPTAAGGPPVVPDSAFPAVLSTTTADTSRPATVDELTARQIVDEVPVPPGFRSTTVVVSGGQGSYRVAAPASYSAVWRVGTPAEDLAEQADAIDPGWAAEFREIAAGADPGGTLRSVTLDTGSSRAGATALIVTLTPEVPESGPALADAAAREFTAQGYPVLASHEVRVNGAAGAYVEFSRTTSEPTRAAVQVRIPDPPNHLLWGVTCEGPEPERDALRDTCAGIAATFRPLPTVLGS
jgi:hypothetical protein